MTTKTTLMLFVAVGALFAAPTATADPVATPSVADVEKVALCLLEPQPAVWPPRACGLYPQIEGCTDPQPAIWPPRGFTCTVNGEGVACQYVTEGTVVVGIECRTAGTPDGYLRVVLTDYLP